MINDEVLCIAEKWLGTPYHHQTSLYKEGCDCLGLIRGIWRELYGWEPLDLPNYSPQWGDLDQSERLLNAANKYFEKADELLPGNVILLYVRRSKSAKHCAIVDYKNRMIHSYIGRGVVRTSIGNWYRHIAGIYSFPEKN